MLQSPRKKKHMQHKQCTQAGIITHQKHCDADLQEYPDYNEDVAVDEDQRLSIAHTHTLTHTLCCNVMNWIRASWRRNSTLS
jgi:hypothetical protein